MPKTKEIRSNVRKQVIGLVKGGHGIREIGRILRFPATTVSYITHESRITVSKDNKRRSVRSRRISERGFRQLKGIVRLNRRMTTVLGLY